MNLADFVTRADEIIGLADVAIPTIKLGRTGSSTDTVYSAGAYLAFRSSGLSFLANTFGSDHVFYAEFNRVTNPVYVHSGHAGRGVLVAARDEVARGWAVTARGLVSAEIFGDFIEMARHLLAEGYKDPAAVVAGSVLEEHLRQLAGKNGVDVTYVDGKGKTVPKKSDVLNADLVKADVYNVLNQKSVTAWLDLRNNAAHGRYSEYAAENVALMIQGILHFMTTVPV